jgi:hypothetical protein
MPNARTPRGGRHREGEEPGSRSMAGFLAAICIVGAIVAFAVLFWIALR